MNLTYISCSRQERQRVDPDPAQLSELTTLPKCVPIDWFDVNFWNTDLTLRERANYVKNGIIVALPLEEHCNTWEKCVVWKNLPEEEFMEKFGNAVLKRYHIPTEEELAQLEVWDNEDGENEDKIDDELNDDGVE